MIKKDTTKKIRSKRIPRIRARITGTGKRPRLSVFRSNTSLEVQIVDDVKRTTLCTCVERSKNMKAGELLGKRLVEELKKRKLSRVVFDRRGNRYHGVIQKVADTLREGGITV